MDTRDEGNLYWDIAKKKIRSGLLIRRWMRKGASSTTGKSGAHVKYEMRRTAMGFCAARKGGLQDSSAAADCPKGLAAQPCQHVGERAEAGERLVY